MKSAKYLRDARHLDKFMFTLMDELFYEPVETRYRPFDEYKTPAAELIKEIGLDWTITRDGFWYMVHPLNRFYIPAQGWKVHVSANIGNAVSSEACREDRTHEGRTIQVCSRQERAGHDELEALGPWRFGKIHHDVPVGPFVLQEPA